MRLLLVIPSQSSFHCFFTELAEAWLARGHELHLVAGALIKGGPDKPLPTGVIYYPVAFPRDMNPLSHWRCAKKITRIIQQTKPDIVHAHFSAALFTTALAARTIKRRRGPAPAHSKIPLPCNGTSLTIEPGPFRSFPVPACPRFLGTFHGMISTYCTGWRRLLLNKAERTAIKYLDQVWVLTPDDLAHARHLAPHSDIRMQPGFGLGCRIDRFNHASLNPVKLQKWRQRLDGDVSIDKKKGVTLLFVGRFAAFKGFPLVIRAFLRLWQEQCAEDPGKMPDIRLLLAGNLDPLHPTGLTREEEEAMIRCPGIRNLGFVEDLEYIMALSDALLFPSQREGMPVCVMEALSMHLPVITSNLRGGRDLVQDGQNGILLNQLTIADVYNSLITVQKRSFKFIENSTVYDRKKFIKNQFNIYFHTYNF